MHTVCVQRILIRRLRIFCRKTKKTLPFFSFLTSAQFSDKQNRKKDRKTKKIDVALLKAEEDNVTTLKDLIVEKQPG